MAARERRIRQRFRIGLPLAGAVLLTALVWGLLPLDTVPDAPAHPAVVAGICWAGQLWFVGYALDPKRAVGPLWRYVLGVANAVTLVRGGLYAVVAGFVVVPSASTLAWVPALAYGAGVALDALDGTLARTVGEETRLGEHLDMAFDTFGFVVAPLVAVSWGYLPVWYLSLSAARYVYRGGLGWRRRRGRPVYDPPDSDLGRYLAGVQMVFLTAALAPAVPRDLIWTLAPVVLAPSLGVFARDFLVASGRLGNRPQASADAQPTD
jgi:CDP-diacylglycerol--glycerol-3-phosphate 3-phosphatidyltransferase